jgi:hypothetical protein
MLFDKLAGFAERFRPDLVPLLEQTRIFEFPGRSHEVLNRIYPEEELSDFFLPFSNIVIEDSASAIMLLDTEENQQGLNGPRRFIEILDTATDSAEFNDSEFIKEQTQMFKGQPSAYVVSFGSIFSVKSKPEVRKFHAVGGVVETYYFNKEGLLLHLSEEDILATPLGLTIVRAGVKNALTALEEVLFFNQPSSFVVEASPVKPRPAKPGRVTRSHDRPHYTVLPAGEVRKRLGLAEPRQGERSTPTPHERRRHWRTLTSDKFTKMKGQKILIPASWIGPSEAKVGNKYYRVRFDL